MQLCAQQVRNNQHKLQITSSANSSDFHESNSFDTPIKMSWD